MSLHIGEFTPAGPHRDQTRIHTRLLFLEEIQTTATEVLESLRDEVLNPYEGVIPVYSTVSAELQAHAEHLKIEAWLKKHPTLRMSPDKLASICLVVTLDGPGGMARLEAYARNMVRGIQRGNSAESFSDRDLALIRDLIILDDPTEGGPWDGLQSADRDCHAELVPLRTAIQEWSRKNNLDAEWWRNIGFQTVNAWAGYGECDLEFSWSISEEVEINQGAELALLPFDGFPRWQPANARRRDYLSRLRDWARTRIEGEVIFRCASRPCRSDLIYSVEKMGKAYCQEVERYYESHAWTRVKDKRHLVNHIKWAVAFQTQNKSYGQIAESYEKAVPPVKRAADEILELIGLPKRPSKLSTKRR